VSVCFVIDRLSRAGTETQLLALIRHLNRDAVRPSLCLLNGIEPVSKALQPPECPVLDLGLRKLLGPAAVRAAARLAAFWRRERVGVVQTYFRDSTYFAAPLARLTGIPHVVRVRNNVGYWMTPLHRRLGRLVGRLGLTLTNSDDARRAVLESEGPSPDRVRVIENGVDLDRFPPGRPPDTARSVVRVGAVANLRPVKNIDGFVRVAAAIARDHSRVQFEVAGEGDQRTALQEQVRAAGLNDRFILRGSVEDVPTFLAGLDVAVLCSHSESMSNALLEYMAAGRAIVATDVGANARLVCDRRDGLIVPPGNEAAMEAAIREYLGHPALALRCGAAARERAAAEFSRGAMVRRFEEFFSSLAQS
jgi:glycosyltransferase involved in cell wall biosynthesis